MKPKNPCTIPAASAASTMDRAGDVRVVYPGRYEGLAKLTNRFPSPTRIAHFVEDLARRLLAKNRDTGHHH